MKVAFLYDFSDKDWPGGKNYYSNLISALNLVAPDKELFFFVGKKTTTSIPTDHPQLRTIRTRMLDRGSAAWRARKLTQRLSPGTSDPVMQLVLKRYGIAVLSHAGPLSKASGIKTLAWLPDFQFMYFPAYWKKKQLEHIKKTYETCSLWCDGLIVSSESALSDLRKFTSVIKASAHVLRFPATPLSPQPLPSIDALCLKYKIPDEYLFLPNQFWKHKNHGVVIDALAILNDAGFKATVVCTGQTADFRNPEHFDSLLRHATERGVSAQFVSLGLVPYVDLQALMLNAKAVINPSTFEGWSTTVEEAKLLGKRIILSNLPVHREQAPENARYFDSDDAPKLAGLMREAHVLEAVSPNTIEISARFVSAQRQFGETYSKILESLISEVS